MDRTLFVLTCLAALGSAIVGGIFYGFSSFVMKALGRIVPQQGVAAMNEINLVVIRPSFLLPFMGTGVLCLALALAAWLWWPQPGGGRLLLAAACALYLVGCLGLTTAVNQPMNLRLGAMPAAEALAYWPRYLEAWTFWNHVRTAASLLAAACFVAALLRGPQP